MNRIAFFFSSISTESSSFNIFCFSKRLCFPYSCSFSFSVACVVWTSTPIFIELEVYGFVTVWLVIRRSVDNYNYPAGRTTQKRIKRWKKKTKIIITAHKMMQYTDGKPCIYYTMAEKFCGRKWVFSHSTVV